MKINWFKIELHIIINTLAYFIVQNPNKNQIFEFLNYLKIGIKCKDCEKDVYSCKCNYFENLNLNIVKFIRYNISINQIDFLKKEIDVNFINHINYLSLSYTEEQLKQNQIEILLNKIIDLK